MPCDPKYDMSNMAMTGECCNTGHCLFSCSTHAVQSKGTHIVSHPGTPSMAAGCKPPQTLMHWSRMLLACLDFDVFWGARPPTLGTDTPYLLKSSSVSGAVKSWGSSAGLRSGTNSKGLSTATDKLGEVGSDIDMRLGLPRVL